MSTQARKIIWEGVNPNTGMRFIDEVFPKEIRQPGTDGKREDEMLIRLRCGSTWQLAGSDNYNALVGANVVGVVFSEWSVCDPEAWNYIRPILAENGGWALFIYTARGRNHGYDMAKMAEANPDWFYSLLTVEDTRRDDGSPVIGPEIIEDERHSGMAEEMILQEYYCSFDAPLVGAYYGDRMRQMLDDGRIRDVPYDPRLPVETWWDLGKNDTTAIGFVQRAGTAIYCIDHYEDAGLEMADYIKVVKEKPYVYSEHILPHDVDVDVLGMDRTRKQTLKAHGLTVRVAPKLPVHEGIQATRAMLPRMYMDKTKCDRWIECLRQYSKQWDEKNKIYRSIPNHDWTSNSADMTRYGAVVTPKPQRKRGPTQQPKVSVI